MSIRILAAHGLKWQAIEIAGRQLVSLIVFTSLARLLNPEAFGLLALVGVYLVLAQAVAEQGIAAALVQRKTLEADHLSTAFWFNLACATTLCAATILMAGHVAWIFGEPQLAPVLRWASLSLIINALGTVHGAIFARNLDFRRPALRTFVGNLTGAAIGIGMALADFGVWSLIGQQLGSASAATILFWAVSPWRPTLTFSLIRLQELLSFSWAVLGTSLVGFVSGRTDQLVVGRIFGAAALGQLAAAYRVSDLAKTSLYQPMGAVVFPAFSRLQQDRERLGSAVSRAMSINALVSFPCLLGLSAIATDFVPCLLGPQWRPAGLLLRVLAIYVLLHGLQAVIHYVLLSTGNAASVLWISVMHALGVVLACSLGVAYGAAGIVVALILNDCVICVPRLYALWKETGVSPGAYLRPCLNPAIAAVVMYIVVKAVGAVSDEASWPLLLFQVLAGAAVYVTAMAVVSPRRLQEAAAFIALALHRGAPGAEAI